MALDLVEQADPRAAQRMRHLELANETRFARARMKRRMAKVPPTMAASLAAELLARPDDIRARSFRVVELLTSIPKIGQVKAGNLARRAAVSPTARVDRLTPRRRHELARLLQAEVQRIANRGAPR